MNKTVRFSPMNNIRFVPEGFEASQQYGYAAYGEASYLDSLQTWDANTPFFQKVQFDEVMPLQFAYSVGNIDITAAWLQVCDSSGFIAAVPVDAQTFVTPPDREGNAMVAQQYLFNPSSIPALAGKQFIYLKLDLTWADDSKTGYVSEPIWLAVKHHNTVLLRYSQTTNDYDTNFEQFRAVFAMRVPSLGLVMSPGGESTVFENQVGENRKLFSRTVLNFTWDIGGKTGIPDYMIDRISRALDCDSFSIDGRGYTKEDGASFELISDEGKPLRWYTILLREADHQSSYTFGERDILLWKRPETGYPYAINAMRLTNSLVNITSGVVMMEDAGSEAGYLAALNATRGAWQMDGVYEQVSGSFYYRMAGNESFTAQQATIYSLYLGLPADVSMVGTNLINNPYNFKFTFRGGSIIFSPEAGEGTYYADPALTAITVQHRYVVDGLTEVTPRIFHRNDVLNIGYNGVGISIITHKIKNITGVAPASLQSWDMFNANFGALASLSLAFLEPCRTSLQVLRMERCGIPALTAGWGSTASKSYPRLSKVVLTANTFNVAQVDSFFNELTGLANPSMGTVAIKTIAGASAPTGASSASRAWLTARFWSLSFD